MTAVVLFIRLYKHLHLYGANTARIIVPYSENFDDRHTFRRASKILSPIQDLISSEPTPFLILHPNGKFKNYWSIIVVIMLFYTAIVTPFFQAFGDSLDQENIFWIETIVNILFFIDFCVNCTSAYYDKTEMLITKRKFIILNYLKSWMIVDFISWFPFDLILGNTGSSSKTLARFARIPKLYRLFRLSRLIKLFNKNFHHEIMDKFQDLLSLKSSALRLLKSCLSIVICVHIFACFWYYTAKIYEFTPDTWIVRLGYIDQDIGSIYLTCLYWAITTLSTTGYGDITGFTILEKFLCFTWMACGLYFFSFTISNLNSMLSSFDLKENALCSKLAAIDEFAGEANLKKDLRIKLKNSLKYAAEKRGFSWHDKMNLINELPKNLRYEIAINMHQGAARNLNFFASKDSSLIALVVPLLDPIFVEKDCLVFKEGDFADEIYFVVRGNIRILKEKTLVIKSIQKGCYFGDVEVFMSCSRRFSAVSARYSEILIMNKNIIYQIKENHVLVWHEMMKTALEREKSYEKTLIEIKEMEKFQAGRVLTKRNIDRYNKKVHLLLQERMDQLHRPDTLTLPQLIKKVEDLMGILKEKRQEKQKASTCLKCKKDVIMLGRASSWYGR